MAKKKELYKNLQKNMSDLSYLLDPSVVSDEPKAEVQEKGNVDEVILSIEDLVSFQNHPFKVETDNDNFQQLVDSIAENGLIQPILVRPIEDKYEIIAGHRRTEACKAAGLDKIPAVIRPMDDYEATIVMVHSNFYREKILISEKARAYRMCMEAEKHQGKKGIDTAVMIGQDQDSKRQVYRYIRLSYLSDQLLDYLDNGKIPMNIGIELSYLDEETQDNLVHYIEEYGIFPTIDQAKTLRQGCVSTPISYPDMVVILTSGLKKKVSNNVSFKTKQLQEYFDDGVEPEYMSKVILTLLTKYRDGELDGVIDQSDFI